MTGPAAGPQTALLAQSLTKTGKIGEPLAQFVLVNLTREGKKSRESGIQFPLFGSFRGPRWFEN
jgi:hypothetical protein